MTFKPARSAAVRPSLSSIRIRSANNSSGAKAMASDSPGSRLIASNLAILGSLSACSSIQPSLPAFSISFSAPAVHESIQLRLNRAGNPDLVKLAAQQIQPANDCKVRNRRGITRHQHKLRLALTPPRHSAGECLVVLRLHRSRFDSSRPVRQLCRSKAYLGHTARWLVPSGAVARSRPAEGEGPGAPNPGYPTSAHTPQYRAATPPEAGRNRSAIRNL